jgi:hypothetical protein
METIGERRLPYAGRMVRGVVVRYPLPPAEDGTPREITTTVIPADYIGYAPPCDGSTPAGTPEGAPLGFDPSPPPPAATRLVGYGAGQTPPYMARVTHLPDAPLPRSLALRWAPRIGEATGARRAHCAAASALAPAPERAGRGRITTWWRAVAAADAAGDIRALTAVDRGFRGE